MGKMCGWRFLWRILMKFCIFFVVCVRWREFASLISMKREYRFWLKLCRFLVFTSFSLFKFPTRFVFFSKLFLMFFSDLLLVFTLNFTLVFPGISQDFLVPKTSWFPRFLNFFVSSSSFFFWSFPATCPRLTPNFILSHREVVEVALEKIDSANG